MISDYFFLFTGIGFLIFGVTGIVVLLRNKSENADDKIAVTFFIILGVFNTTVATLHIKKNTKNIPEAIDVYKGKTTLKIIYKDGIPTDSIVVFKK